MEPFYSSLSQVTYVRIQVPVHPIDLLTMCMSVPGFIWASLIILNNHYITEDMEKKLVNAEGPKYMYF